MVRRPPITTMTMPSPGWSPCEIRGRRRDLCRIAPPDRRGRADPPAPSGLRYRGSMTMFCFNTSNTAAVSCSPSPIAIACA